jgi:hypothetical protein
MHTFPNLLNMYELQILSQVLLTKLNILIVSKTTATTLTRPEVEPSTARKCSVAGTPTCNGKGGGNWDFTEHHHVKNGSSAGTPVL